MTDRRQAHFGLSLSHLEDLRDAIAAARARERVQLQQHGVRRDAVHEAHLVTLGALVAYADAISDLCWPVPRTLLFEIRLYEGLTR